MEMTPDVYLTTEISPVLSHHLSGKSQHPPKTIPSYPREGESLEFGMLTVLLGKGKEFLAGSTGNNGLTRFKLGFPSLGSWAGC